MKGIKVMAKSQSWRGTKAYRQWRITVIRRDKTCIICNSKKNRQAHHLNNGSHHPEERFDVSNGVTLCRKCHTVFHTDFKPSYRYKTTKKDFENFIRIVSYVRSLEK